jgi:hypothetical protein
MVAETNPGNRLPLENAWSMFRGSSAAVHAPFSIGNARISTANSIRRTPISGPLAFGATKNAISLLVGAVHMDTKPAVRTATTAGRAAPSLGFRSPV